MLNTIAIVLGILSIACLALGIGLAYFELAPVTAGMALYAGAGLLGLCAVAVAIAILFTTRHMPAFFTGMAGAIPVVVVFASVAAGMRYPAINDVTTDTANPPAFAAIAGLPENAGRDMAFPQEFADVIERNYADIQPLQLAVPRETAFARARQAAADSGWQIIAESPETGIIEAVSVTPLFRFRDDIVVRVTGATDSSRIDVRSKSRLGRSDLGANAKRIQAYLGRVSGE